MGYRDLETFFVGFGSFGGRCGPLPFLPPRFTFFAIGIPP